MAGSVQPRTNDSPSSKYRYNPHDIALFDHGDFVSEDYPPSSSSDSQQNHRNREGRPSEILSTSEVISAVGQIWDFATQTFSGLHPKTNSNDTNEELREGTILCYPSEDGMIVKPSSTESQKLSVNLKSSSSSLHMRPPNFDNLCVVQKMTLREHHGRSNMYSLFWSYPYTFSNMWLEPCKDKGIYSAPILYDLQKIYGWMNELRPAKLENLVDSNQTNNKKIGVCCFAGGTSSLSSCSISAHTTFSANKMTTRSANCSSEDSKLLETSSEQNVKDILRTNAVTAPVCSNCYPERDQDMDANCFTSITLRPSVQANCCDSVFTSGRNSCTESQHDVEDDLTESYENERGDYIIGEKSAVEICSAVPDKPQYSLAKQEHAFAGAFAGIFVSLCLHPVDTVKTVIQSCRTDQKSILYISKSIISERGVSGLYRGIASNIASSAPISAVYTFTYESVKGILIPHLAKEHHSLAHCTAGGCASIATSFIFTPSERIKQQMQVGSHYQNCWNALLGIVGKGGFSSLYAGWGAVLCRNVPHSIIKFYTYESLKQFMLSSRQSNAQPTTISTLICGGVAGSTAALFTTPFDVVKTRLQTQIPGSTNRYDGVFNTLKDISRHEGLKGLYRGLTPRLAMYMTQGALFFASYESFKRLFFLEVPKPSTQKIQLGTKSKDDLTSLSNAS